MASATFSLPTDLTPYASKSVLASNYLNFHGASGSNWSQQYLPELYAEEVEKYGNRSVSSFLRMVGAEMPMASDQVIWSEQGRLHLAYEGAAVDNAGVITIASSGTHAVRVGQTIVLSDNQSTPTIIKCYVSAIAADNTTLTAIPYVGGATVGAVSGFDTTDDNAANTCSFFVYGSEFKKGQAAMDGSVTPEFESFTNKPIILKDKFEISGSDAAQIGWVEVSGEGGQNGYLWYLKAEGDTRVRFEDYLEMSMVEAEKSTTAGGVDSILGANSGTEGLFSALENRGIVATDAFDAASDVIADFDLILKELDKQGSIEENMLFLDRNSNLILDDGLGQVNANYNGGTSFGVFENSQDMALNLGFSGFRRGSYDFYKTDWKYLNNKSTRGLFSDIKGVLVPAGTSSVYDQILGSNIRRPFLHVRYRASEADDRKMKSWITGSVGGASTSGDDLMSVHYLSERCLVTQAANNFVLFK
tara:strand:+ start:467 stop:1888 length:1422 start_codon:yes stop_codon:yes gene_type:complete